LGHQTLLNWARGGVQGFRSFAGVCEEELVVVVAADPALVLSLISSREEEEEEEEEQEFQRSGIIWRKRSRILFQISGIILEKEILNSFFSRDQEFCLFPSFLP
jgi:hypothetical protein